MKFPVPAVRLIVPDDRGRVLILRRSATRYGKGDWCLPGGKVDYGATVEQTVVQELAEETSLFCVTSEFLFYRIWRKTPAFRHGNISHFRFRFFASAKK